MRTARPITRVAASAVIENPLAGQAGDDISILASIGEELGERLIAETISVLASPVLAYGKAAIVGTSGEIEHAAAIIHPLMGKPIRKAIGGGKAVIPSNVKVGLLGASIDVPLANKDDVWCFEQSDTMSVVVPGAPRPEGIVVIIVVCDGGRPRPRVFKAGAISSSSSSS